MLGAPATTSPLQAWSPAERERCAVYVQKWEKLHASERCEWPQLVCHLGDNPATGWTTWSAKSQAIPTIRKSSGVFALPAAGRQLTQKELYLAMGYPTYPILAQTAQIPLYELNASRHSDHRRALGNSMHVASCGVFVTCFLASVRDLNLTQEEPVSN